MTILETITRAAGCKTNKAKVLMLVEGGSEQLRDYLKLVLDPQHVFNMTLKTLPEPRMTSLGIPYRYTLFTILEALRDGLRGGRAQQEITHFWYWATASERQLFRYAIDRKLPGNIGVSLVNKAFPWLIYKQPYGGIKAYDPDWIDRRFDWEAGVLLQEKEDGMCLFLTKSAVDDLGCQGYAVHTRQGQDVSDALSDPFLHIFDAMQDNSVFQVEGRMKSEAGELMDRPEANGVYNSMFKGETTVPNNRLYIVAIDVIGYSQFHAGKDPTLWHQRYTKMYDVVDKYLCNNFANARKADNYPVLVKPDEEFVHSKEEAREFVRGWISAGGEGGVLKDTNGVWKDGKMTSQMKLKNEFECTLKVIDWKPHSVNPAWVGSLLCVSEASLGTIIQTYVGSGLNEEAGHPLDRTQGGDHFVGELVEIKAECITKHNALQIPRIVEVRSDKAVADTYWGVVCAFDDSVALEG